MRMRKGLVAAMESEQNTLPVNDTDELVDPKPGDPLVESKKPEVIEFPEGAETAETEFLEAAKTEGEVAALEEQIEEGLDANSALDQLAQTVERANENGGLDPVAADLLNQALEHLYDRVGIPTRANGGVQHVPSLESFGGTSSRIDAGQIALEDIKENMRRIGSAVAKTLRVLIEKVRAYITQLLDATERNKARIEKTRAAVENYAPTNNVTTVENARVASQLSVGTSVPTNLAQALSEVEKLGNYIFNSNLAMTTELGKKYLALLKLAPNLEFDVLMTRVGELAPDMIKLAPENQSPLVQDVTIADGLTTGYSPVLLGNKRFVSVFPEMGDPQAFIRNIAKTRLSIETVEGGAPAELKVLNSQQMKQVLDVVGKITESVLSYRGKQQQIDSLKMQLAAATQGLDAALQKTTDGTQSMLYQALASSVTAAATLLDAGPREFTKYAGQTVKAALDLIELSMKAGREKAGEGEQRQIAAA